MLSPAARLGGFGLTTFSLQWSFFNYRRSRMKLSFKNTIFSFFLAVALVLNSGSQVMASSVTSVNSQEEINTAISLGFEYLKTQMNADGGIRWFDESSSVAASLRVVQSLAAAGYTQSFLNSAEGKRPIDYVAMNARAWVDQEETDNPSFSPARAGVLLTAVAAANENPHKFGADKINLIREINQQYDSNSGAYGGATPENVLDQVWAMIGLAANNAPVPEDAHAWLVSAQAENGSWNDGFGSFMDTTPLGIIAMVSTGQHDADTPPVQSALTFMLERQDSSGGWQSDWDTTTNANITAVMLQAIHLLDQHPEDEIWQKPDGNPASALLAVQGESGAFGGDFANAYSTADAIVALAGRSISNLGILEIISNSFDFVFDTQEEDGGWGSMGQTLDTLIALRVAGWNPNTVAAGQNAPLDYIAENFQSYLENGPDAKGKAILGLVAAGKDPRNFNGVDLIDTLEDAYDQDAGAFGSPENTWHQALPILGLHAASREIPQGVITTLIDLQQEDGGWEYTPGFGSSPDNTSIALQALLAAGYSPEDPPLVNAIQYLQASQTNTGGWGDSSSTAYASMAINALGVSKEDWVTETGKDPIANLLSYQKANGSFVYNWEFSDDNLMSTVTALLVLFDGSYLLQWDPVNSANQAAIVVVPGEGTVYADCVEFKEETISGLDLLERSGFSYDMQQGFIDGIMGVKNPEGETNYWSYWSWDGREWVFNNSGAGDSMVFPGSVEAWHFTSWEVFPSLPPEFIPDVHHICDSEVLKIYSEQPYLNFDDLFNVPMQEFESPLTVNDEPSESSDPKPTETLIVDENNTTKPTTLTETTQEPNQEVTSSNLPLIIIAGAGSLVLIVILAIVLQKRK
jgi:prenyltransferase beta subunit